MKASYPVKGKLVICMIFALSSVTYYSLGPETINKDAAQVNSNTNTVEPDRRGFLVELVDKFKVSEGALFDPAYWARSMYNLQDFTRY